MDKKGVMKLFFLIFLIAALLIFIFQVGATSYSNKKIFSNSNTPSFLKAMAVGGGGVIKDSAIKGFNKINVRKNRYASPDNKAPIVTLIKPSDNSIDDDGEVEFIFSVQDDSLLRDCILYHNINGEWLPDEKNKNTFVQPNYPLHFTIKDVLNGDYNWNILCTDDAFNTNSNNNFSFTVKKILPKALTITDQVLKEDGIFTIDLTNYFSDPKGDSLSYSVQLTNNLKISIDNKTGIAIIEPERNFVGEKTIIFTAFDEHGSKVDSNPVKISISEEGDTPPRFISTLTKDGEVDTDGYLFIECNATDDEGLKEVSLYSDTSGTWRLEETKEVSGLDNFVEFLIKDLPEGNYEWACSATDKNNQKTMGERQKIKVDIDVELEHRFPSFMVNNINTNRWIIIKFSNYLKDSLTLGNLIIKKSNGEIYYERNFSKVQYVETNSTILYGKKIKSIPSELFNGQFEIGNSVELTFILEYEYQGKKKIKEIEHKIERVRR